MSGSIHKEFKPLAKIARQAGWTIEISKSCHLKWRSPNGALVVSAGTPSDSARSVKNLTAQLRRAGLEV